MQKRSETTRSPLKEEPARDPGQSLRDELDDVLYGSVLICIGTSLFALLLAGLEWYRWAFRLPPTPILLSCLAVVVAAVAFWRGSRAYKRVEGIKLGLKGERVTGQFLQQVLAPLGYDVLHDICFDGFNIDHVVVGPGGVFCIETKTRSKPARGDARVTYDGTNVLVNGQKPDRDPVVQAMAGAGSLKKLVLEYSGHEVDIRPVVLYPGWWVDRQPRGVEVWVLNAKAFVGWLKREPTKLTREQQRVVAFGLRRYVREKGS